MIGNPMGNVLGNPLGNPLGLAPAKQQTLKSGGVLIMTFTEGSGKFTIPAGFKYAAVWGVSGGGAGMFAEGGGAGGWAKTPTVALNGSSAEVKYEVGAGGIFGIAAGDTKVEGLGFSFFLSGAVSNAPGQLISYTPGVTGGPGVASGASSNNGPAGGGKNGSGYCGGGAGLAGLRGGTGLTPDYNGGASTCSYGPDPLFTQTPNASSQYDVRGRSGGQDYAGTRSGDGGEGGGGGGQGSSATQAGKGGAGIVRIFAWNPPASGLYAEAS